jgi:hypothetical protein
MAGEREVILSMILQSSFRIRLGVYTIGNSIVGEENLDNYLITGNTRIKMTTNCDNGPGGTGYSFLENSTGQQQ